MENSKMNWKSPPPEPGMLWVNKSLEIQILLGCNWNCHACFMSASKVYLSDGRCIPISDVKVGDTVLSFDERTKLIVDSKVSRVMSRKVDQVYCLKTTEKVSTRGSQNTYVTPDHLFLLYQEGRPTWVSCYNLTVGDNILTLTGLGYDHAHVDRIVPMKADLDDRFLVYNLEVENTHTYIVNGMIVHNCDQFSNLPSISWVRKATMSIAQIENFCEEMRSNNAYVGRIRVVGGEPSIHPQLSGILTRLKSLSNDGHVGQIEIITNGSHKNRVIGFKNQGYIDKVRISDEGDKQKHHTANLVHTPNSLGYEGKMCNAPWHCGISLNYYGYFPCSSGAGLSRLMDNVPTWQRLSLPKKPVLEEWPDLQKLCNFCYHGLRDEDKIKCGTDNYQLNVPGEESWSNLGPWLHGKQQDWTPYAQQESKLES